MRPSSLTLFRIRFPSPSCGRLLFLSFNVGADAMENRVTLASPRLPPWLGWLEIRGLRVAKSPSIGQGRGSAAVELPARSGGAEVLVSR